MTTPESDTTTSGSQATPEPDSTTAAEPTATPAPVAPASATSASAAPKPRPRPGPRPGVKPVVTSAPITHQPTHAGDPHEFGRVDEKGVVWLKTADGEREIGQWQAGSPEEGLAHYSRRFEDLATEVEILEERLAARSGDPRKTRAAAQHLLDALPTAHVIGDVAALQARLGAIAATAEDVAEEVKAQRAQDREAAVARKEALAAEAEGLAADSTQWKEAGDRIRAILDEWRGIKGIDRKTDDALWKRYARARDKFNRRRGAHFAELDRDRASAKDRKEELIAQAEELSTSTDWGPTAGRFRDLMTEWKAAGRAPREVDDALWQRFKAAQDVFFGARNAEASQRDEEFSANGEAKAKLLDEAERTIDPKADLAAARRAYRLLQERWDEIGKVPRDQMGRLDGRMRALERKIRDAENESWRREDPEVAARAAQFAEKVAALEEQARKADERGKTSDAKKFREQAKQWQEWADAAKTAVSDR
ncbi:DUF349 domain-containing protein [Gordonia sp. X0973]|uniref:DUF349 domain-containing protein n=1 Tax=Gordonia sp. X0973 TaxID=2742602 RepID=UPI000F541F05|nr:DUF349 domain-containing protein [Gordonia sp. X0973]QKT07485.1 DUF349 domain-containing protein [Gordonia sp. X0973]